MHENIDQAILSNGFRFNTMDKCLYSKTCGDYVVIVCLYGDDILILSGDMKEIMEMKRFLSSTYKMKEIMEMKRFLSSTYEMKDLGEVDTILGIKIKRNIGGYALNQTH